MPLGQVTLKHIGHTKLRQNEATSSTNDKTSAAEENIGIWPCGDALDKQILDLAFPALVNFAIFPLVGAADTFWVGRMCNALALAGQGAANQVFNSAFWFMSFLPSVMTPMVAKAHGAGDTESVKERVGEAFFVGMIVGLIGVLGLSLLPGAALNLVMPGDAAARIFATPYLAIRGLTFSVALLSTVGFAAFRGTLDIITPLKITVISNMVNIIMDPILIFPLKMGVSGAAAATCLSELTSFILYTRELLKRKILSLKKVFTPPSRKQLTPLLVGGLSVLLRSLAVNAALIAVTRTTQMLDTTGTSAAAHSITLQLFQLGAALAMNAVSSVIVPSIRAKAIAENTSELPAKQAADRILVWGLIVGLSIGALQLLSLPLLGLFSPLAEVQEAARLPSIIGACQQVLNCFIWTGEGIQQGNEDFMAIAVATSLGAAAMLLSLQRYGNTLVGVWGSYTVLAIFRLTGMLRHHFISGPFSRRNRTF
eukprot:CAMPEP_0174962610 /NCGR_PEP_ID=MMETSP0004_2-20121128/4874_1 /TAXON_ID=420556 /ORGANISM="Ochromonas sp., Strain CCMP1393" /LENGTH=481 /DNA_ID=CAMNT_0016211151 /DNA_START=23 /DNA_END=1468 /DNA_ORIENTATION=+